MTVVTISGISAASGDDSGPVPEINTEDLRERDAREKFEEYAAEEPIDETITFVEEETDYGITENAVSGTAVDGDDFPDYVILDIPLDPRPENEYLEVRILEESVAAEVVIEDDAYRSMPALTGDNTEVQAATEKLDSEEAFDQDVVNVYEWYNDQIESDQPGVQSTASVSCWEEGTFDVGGPAWTSWQPLQ